LRGWLFSIIRTYVFSFCVILCFFPLMAFFAFKTSITEPVQIAHANAILPSRFIISLIVLTMFTYILAPWYGQKIFAARTQKTAFLSVIFAAVLVFLLYGLAVMSTWFFRENGGVAFSAQEALPMMMARVLPVGLKGLGYGILFAASATTLSGVWSAMGTLIVGDFLKKGAGHTRSIIVCLALISFVLANTLVDQVFDKLILANIPIAALSFALLAGFYWKKTSRFGAYASIIVGWAFGIVSYFHFGEAGGYTWYWAVLGIPAIFITGIFASILIPNKQKLDIAI
ncbi:MAG: hypothetical protein K1000chlam2_01690, partial [Chlamydiae bacterium]|nr:hypothetical protein [Chlamydiota bacterium]